MWPHLRNHQPEGQSDGTTELNGKGNIQQPQ
jgi:hypothetical protein